MRKADLINKISDKTGIPKVDVLVTLETMFKEMAGETQIVVASRYQETAVYCIDGNRQFPAPVVVKPVRAHRAQQLTLF